MDNKVKSLEEWLVEIACLKRHIVNYAKTREIYVEYRKSRYISQFFELHKEAITLHKAAKAAFDELNVKKLPKTKELSKEYAEVLADKKAVYVQYRKARSEMKEILKAKKNGEQFLSLNNEEKEREQKQKKKEPQR